MLKRTWTDERIESELRKAVEELHLDRMPKRYELDAWWGSSALRIAVTRYGGLRKWSKVLGLPIVADHSKKEVEVKLINPQCERCFAWGSRGCEILVKAETEPCFAFKTHEDVERSREKAEARLREKGLSYPEYATGTPEKASDDGKTNK